MIFTIHDTCISCGVCKPECPVNCISVGEDYYIIDESQCIGCGACAEVCPVDAPQQV